MRLAILTLALVALGCSKKEPPPEAAEATESEAVANAEAAEVSNTQAEGASPANPAPTEPAELPPEEPPVVELITAGKPPLEELRRQFKAGAKQVFQLQHEETIKLKGGGWDNFYTPRGIVQTIGIETKTVSKDGVADVAFKVRKVKELMEIQEPNAHLMNTTDVEGRYKIDSRGVISDLEMTPPPTGKIDLPFLDTLRGQLRWMVPPFPEEPVGVGAKWTVAKVANEYQTQMTEHADVELIERTSSKIVLRFEFKSTGMQHHAFQLQPQDITFEIDTRGNTTLNPSEIVPRSATFETRVVQTVTMINEEPPDGPLVVTTERTVGIKSK